jgi:hypothetical protein
MWFDPGLAGLFITSTLLHLGEDINSLVVSLTFAIDANNIDFTHLLFDITNRF